MVWHPSIPKEAPFPIVFSFEGTSHENDPLGSYPPLEFAGWEDVSFLSLVFDTSKRSIPSPSLGTTQHLTGRFHTTKRHTYTCVQHHAMEVRVTRVASVLGVVGAVLVLAIGFLPFVLAIGALATAYHVLGGIQEAKKEHEKETKAYGRNGPVQATKKQNEPEMNENYIEERNEQVEQRKDATSTPNDEGSMPEKPLTGSAAILARLKQQRAQSRTNAEEKNRTMGNNASKGPGKQVHVLHGGEAAAEVARDLVDEARRQGYDAKAVPMDDFKGLNLEEKSSICLFVVETVENAMPAEAAGTCVRYFNRKRKQGEAGLLQGKLHYAVIALGDTNLLLDRQTTTAKDCNQAGQALDTALHYLGAARICNRCEANDAVGFEEAVTPWLSNLWKELESVCKSDKEAQKEMQSGPELLILYGSQTGNSAEIAKNIGAECTEKGVRNQVMEMQEAGNPTDVWKLGTVTLVVVSSTGDGDPPDNCATFYSRLRRRSNPPDMLQGVKFAVLGLGDQNYTDFMAVPRTFHRRLEDLGGEAFLPRMEIDEVEGIEQQLEEWTERFWPALEKTLSRNALDGEVKSVANGEETLQAKDQKSFLDLERVPPCPVVRVLIEDAEMPLLDIDPNEDEVHLHYQVPVQECILLTDAASDRRVLHLDVDVSGTELAGSFSPGDSIGVLPCNDHQLVDELLERLQLDPNRVFKITPASDAEKDKQLLPHIKTPCSVRKCFLEYVDITSVPRKSFLRLLAEFCTDDNDKYSLMELCSRNGRELYNQQIQKAEPGLLDILKKYKSCAPSLESLVDALPPLLPRMYSITNSPLRTPNNIQVAFSVVQYVSEGGFSRRGVATNWLDSNFGPGTAPGSNSLSIFLKSGGHFRLPEDISAPLIMIGPGTGVAPFRGFLQHRAEQAQKEQEQPGEMWLFYGCRRRNEDYLYGSEFESMHNNGTVKLVVAFSREQDHKVYVQDKMLEHQTALYDLICKSRAYIFVCGDGAKMAKDVHACLEKILCGGGMSSADASSKLSALTKEGKYIRDIWS